MLCFDDDLLCLCLLPLNSACDFALRRYSSSTVGFSLLAYTPAVWYRACMTYLLQGRVLSEMPALADRNSILIRETRLENTIICHPQQQNLHGQIFGGFLMQRAFELAFSTCYVFGGIRPLFLEVDHVDFLRPVSLSRICISWFPFQMLFLLYICCGDFLQSHRYVFCYIWVGIRDVKIIFLYYPQNSSLRNALKKLPELLVASYIIGWVLEASSVTIYHVKRMLACHKHGVDHWHKVIFYSSGVNKHCKSVLSTWLWKFQTRILLSQTQLTDKLWLNLQVDVGDLLRFKACVLYTETENVEQPLIHIEVVAHVTQPENRSSEVCSYGVDLQQ